MGLELEPGTRHRRNCGGKHARLAIQRKRYDNLGHCERIPRSALERLASGGSGYPREIRIQKPEKAAEYSKYRLFYLQLTGFAGPGTLSGPSPPPIFCQNLPVFRETR
jgi:hypothetical protein